VTIVVRRLAGAELPRRNLKGQLISAGVLVLALALACFFFCIGRRNETRDEGGVARLPGEIPEHKLREMALMF